MDQFIAFAAPVQNQPTARDPVSVFFAKIERQIGFAEQAKRGDKVSARVTWFRPGGSGYRLKIGREGLKFGEHQWFAAATLDEVIERLRMAKAVIEGCDALRAQIATKQQGAQRAHAGRTEDRKPA